MRAPQTSHGAEDGGMSVVESTNKLSPSTFSSRYLPPDLPCPTIEDVSYTISFAYAQDLSEIDLNACFKLIELTSSAAYKSSSRGWKPKTKKREMSEKDMRYLLVKPVMASEDSSKEVMIAKAQPETAVTGFLSFMITEEDGYEVLYIYEIHLLPHVRQHGMGRYLMQYVEEIAVKVGVEKAMLTVFTSNEVTERFYRKIGYVDDEYSPQPKQLRNGLVKRPDYIIMSKAVSND